MEEEKMLEEQEAEERIRKSLRKSRSMFADRRSIALIEKAVGKKFFIKWAVGDNGITKIQPYEEEGGSLWFLIWKKGKMVERVSGAGVVVDYG